MAGSVEIVTSVRDCGDELPEWATEFAILSRELSESGTLKDIETRARLNRTGYQGFDVVMFVAAYHASGLNCGFKEFARRASGYGEKLAALWGRKRWPTPAAISRALKSACATDVQEFVDWLLLLTPSTIETLSSATYADTEGESWVVFHWDPTAHVFHQRALPNRGDDPPAVRRSDAISAPGYPGRKRGNAVLSQSKLNHSGTGMWHGLTLSEGNAGVREELGAAMHQIEHWCESRRWRPTQTIVVVDGATQGVPQVDIGRESEVAVLTRLACYQVLEAPRAAEHLRGANWEVVDDSGSGPLRYAAEFGVWSGCRIIVSRFQGDDASGSGKSIDGWHYELFAFTCLTAAWPPAELVSLYYGRCAIENRFAQENAEFGLDKIFSYSAAGQMLCLAIGMWVWNRRTLRGAALALAQGEVLEKLRAPSARARQGSQLPFPEVDDSPETDVGLPERLDEDVDPALLKANWFRFTNVADTLERFPGWGWKPERASLICPTGELAVGFNVQRTKLGWAMRFQTRGLACRNCPKRPDCTSSTSKTFRKEIAIQIPLGARLLTTGPDGAEALAQWRNEPITRAVCVAGPLAVRSPNLLPARLRRLVRNVLVDSRSNVVMERGPQAEDRTPFLASSNAEKSHRRQTWGQRLQWNKANHRLVCVQVATTAPLLGIVA